MKNTKWLYYLLTAVLFLGMAQAHKDSWRTDNQQVYNGVTIWDSMNPWAPKTTYTYTYKL